MNDTTLSLDPALARLREQVLAAAADRRPLRLHGGGTKDWYGEPGRAAEPLDLRAHRGIVDYEPTELVVTVRCGTPLAELEAALAERGQMLGFEPPRFGEGATVGGCVAAGLSGPRRAAAGSVRDFVLGTKLLDARGRLLSFGGQVMKNVAGYDVSRLLTGSLGVLGAIVEVSMKVLPLPAAELTLRLPMTAAEALERFNRWGGQPLPVSATAWLDGQALVRLSGARAAVDAAVLRLGGERLDDVEAAAFWTGLREQTLPAFGERPGRALWRLSVPSVAKAVELPGDTVIEWGGALRWLSTDAPAQAVRDAAVRAGGTAMLWKGGDPAAGVFHPLPPTVLTLHRRLKNEFDPDGLFNPGRLHPEL